ncbi:MAG TPA: bifunctional riboflavin kinase/FAD synthetase [Chitinophagaceae bacterium]|nr:bifunctional riboflavin kinase/FAD synthetase [Chitinophagaceae bacterium]
MRVFKGLSHLPKFIKPVITIGTFDGVHLGHKKILDRLHKKAKDIGGESILITFEPHPRLVISKDLSSLALLNTLDEKIRSLETMEIDNVVVVPFTKEFSEISAHSYIQDFIVKHFHPHTFIIGYDHHFGKNRIGNYQLLEKVKDEFGFQLEEITVQEIEHIAVSSTKIREALLQGQIKKASEFLGKNYSLEGKVIHGEKRGRLIGFPTANIEVCAPHKLIPGKGVYLVKVFFDDIIKHGMLNIGVRPTISNSNHQSIEVHIFDFDNNLYDNTIRVEFIDRLRDEIKFGSIEELIQQLNRDKTQALSLL